LPLDVPSPDLSKEFLYHIDLYSYKKYIVVTRVQTSTLLIYNDDFGSEIANKI